MLDDITIPAAQIATFCQRHHIRKMMLFGSVVRGDFTPNSDIDVLVEFEEGYAPGWEFVAMQDELAEILGRDVDLNTPGFLSDTFRDDVLGYALVVYER